ncbi:MAG: glycosyltransferase family 4 protein [Acidimicrobiales bacterium]
MRVAVNVEQLLHASPGGIGRYTEKLVGTLGAMYPEDQIVPFSARHRRADLDRTPLGVKGVDIVPLALPRPVLYDSWRLLGWPAVQLGRRALGHLDVVHAPSLAVPPAGPAALVVTVHDAAPALFPESFSRRGLRFHAHGMAAARQAELVIAVSEAAADEIVAHGQIDRGRVRVVPHGVEPLAVTAERRRDVLGRCGLAGQPYVLWVGSLEPRKGVGTLVSAMARMTGSAGGPRSQRPRLVLAGYRGWLSDGIIDAGDRAALGEHLVQLGPVGEEDLWALYAGAAVFALPSRHEGFGLPALEAMSQGVAVVCSDIPALRQLVGQSACLVAPGDVGAWADALGGLLGDPAARARLGVAGQVRSKLFTWEATASATRQIYEEARVMARARLPAGIARARPPAGPRRLPS